MNRGVAAIHRGPVFVGVLDGRLAAVGAANGEPVWEVVTVHQSQPYAITDAPRVIDAKVIIGNGGAEYGVRGYVSAWGSEIQTLFRVRFGLPAGCAKEPRW